MSDEDEDETITLPDRLGQRGDIVMDALYEQEFKDAIAALPSEDQVSGLDARRHLVVKMVAAGCPVFVAAELCGISRSMAYNAVSAVRKDGSVGSSDHLRRKQSVLVDMALDGAIMANEKLLEMMENDAMRPSEMVKTYSELQKTVMKRFNWGDQGPVADDRTKNALASALDALRGGAEVSIKSPDEADKAKVLEAEIVVEDD